MNENWYDRHLLPHLLDFACGMKPVRRQCEIIVPQARGRVLEVGIGTGLNMPFYDKSRVRYLLGVDPALQMHRLADAIPAGTASMYLQLSRRGRHGVTTLLDPTSRT